MARHEARAGLPDPPEGAGPFTLAIDVGGTGVKASVLDRSARMMVPRVWVRTPHPCPPEALLREVGTLVRSLPRFDRVSIGFPGMVRDGRVITAPHFEDEPWHGFPLAEALAAALGKPARLLNDAEIQGLGVITGEGLEMALTLGTGAGTGLFSNGRLTPHLELAHHPVHKGKTYNQYVGRDALERVGAKRWNRRVLRVVAVLDGLVRYDRLFIGGGNAVHVTAALPENVTLVSNDAGITGGIALWREGVA